MTVISRLLLFRVLVYWYPLFVAPVVIFADRYTYAFLNGCEHGRVSGWLIMSTLLDWRQTLFHRWPMRCLLSLKVIHEMIMRHTCLFAICRRCRIFWRCLTRLIVSAVTVEWHAPYRFGFYWLQVIDEVIKRNAGLLAHCRLCNMCWRCLTRLTESAALIVRHALCRFGALV